MNCIICNNTMYDKFNDTYIISYCDKCKLVQTELSIFKNIIESQILGKKYKSVYYSYMIDLFLNTFGQEKFGLINKFILCTFSKFCAGSSKNSECFIYQYEYHKFKFYYCYYNSVILYNPDDIDILIKFLYKQAKYNRFKMLFFNYINYIKKLFIIKDDEKIEGIKDVKK